MASKILLIDDNKDDLERFRRILSEDGHAVVTAGSGDAGLKLLASEGPDLVVADLVMPGLDGFEVCRRISMNENFQHIPVLLLTIKVCLDDKLMGFELGAADFITKGADPRELKMRVQRLLRTKKLYDEIRQLSIVDSLTGIYNRRYFQHRIYDEYERAKRYSRNFCCLILDLDNFKNINDTLGHAAGDYVLKKVASIMRRNVRAADILCRYGGDEFMVILPETDAQGAGILAERMRQIMEIRKMDFKSTSITLTVSGGISTYQDGTNFLTVEELVTQADVALYQAKRAGRNRVMIYGQK